MQQGRQKCQQAAMQFFRPNVVVAVYTYSLCCSVPSYLAKAPMLLAECRCEGCVSVLSVSATFSVQAQAAWADDREVPVGLPGHAGSHESR